MLDTVKSAPKVLVVDQESNNLDLLELHLLRAGYRVIRASDGAAALRLYTEQRPDLVLLEVILPRINGLEVLRRLRSQTQSNVPVIMVSAKNQEEDKLLGFEEGADDYITKPFSPPELMVRVKVALRRRQEWRSRTDGLELEDSHETIQVGNIRINRAARRVELDGENLDLRPKEFDLLWFLASNSGRVYSREQLLAEVWNYPAYGDLSTVTVHMRRLREKVEVDPMRPRYLKTVWGIGYKFEP